MPKIKLTGPQGQIKTVSVNAIPNEEEMQQIVSQVFGAQEPLSTQAPLPSASDPISAEPADLGALPPEQRLDVLEEQARPGIGEFAIGAARGAREEIGQLLELGEQFVKSPIRTSKIIKKSLSEANVEDAKQFAKDLATDFGRTIGFDITRPGQGLEKFDLDVAINRWQNQPLSAIGDMLVFTKAAQLAKEGAKKASARVTMHNAIKKSPDEIKDMTEAIAEAKKKAVERGAQIEVLTPGEKVALKADVIKKINLKNLNSKDFATNTSVQLADRIFEVGRREGKLMNKALDKVKDKPVNTSELGRTIKNRLVDQGFADNLQDALDVAVTGAKGDDAVNVITPLNKKKLSSFLELIESGEKAKVKDMKQVLDSIDESINWVTPRTSDQGLKIMRSSIRDSLGQISPNYDKIASRISDRLTELGFAEKKIRRAQKEGFLRNYKEKVGLEIVNSDERSKAFLSAMDRVGDETAAAAIGKFDLVDAWKAWNDLYGTNQGLFSLRGDFRGGLAESALTRGRQVFRSQFPGIDIGQKAREAAEAVGIAAREAALTGKRAAKGAAIGSTLVEGVIEE